MKHFTKKDKQNFIDICNSSISMGEACRKLNLHFNTFKRYAIKFECYNPNQGLKGGKRREKKNKIKTSDILEGKYPQFQTYKLKIRLLEEGYLQDKCNKCGWDKKRKGDKYSPCELHHKDGNRFNHTLNNLEILCPNCHSLTPTYRAKNIEHLNRNI